MSVWAWEITIPAGLVEDASALASHLDRERERAVLAAHEAGVTINGDPRVTTQNAVWVDDWSAEGGAMVSEQVARMAGSDAPVTAQVVHLEWDE